MIGWAAAVPLRRCRWSPQVWRRSSPLLLTIRRPAHPNIRYYNWESVCPFLSIVLPCHWENQKHSHLCILTFVFFLLSIYVAYKTTQNSLLLCGYEAPPSSRRTRSTSATPCGFCLTSRELLKGKSENVQLNVCGLYSFKLFCFPSKFIKAACPPGLWVVDWLEILSVDKLSFSLNCVHACINTHFIKLWQWQRRVCLHQKGIFSLPGCLGCQLELAKFSWDAAE